MASSEHTIGELAKAADVPTSTIRYYERRGLMEASNRSEGNYRLYGPEALERLRFIRSAQATGFTLDDVVALLGLRVLADRPCEDVQLLMEERLADVKKRMSELRHVQRVLTSFLEKCQSSNRRDHCAVIEELNAACCPTPPRGQARGRVGQLTRALRESGVESRFGADDSRLRVEVLRLIAKGRPVSTRRVEQIASRLGMAVDAATSLISKVSERDAEGNVVGILGLSQKRHRHRFELDGRVFWTWCAWDALFLPALISRTAEVESACPVTSDPVRLRVTPKKVAEVVPRATVVSMAVPRLKGKGPPAVEEVWKAFCQHVHFFRSEQAASQWISKKKGRSAYSLCRRGLRAWASGV